MAFGNLALRVIATLVLPPAGAFMAGRSRPAIALTALALLAVAIFFFVAWGPAVLLWLGLILAGLVAALRHG